MGAIYRREKVEIERDILQGIQCDCCKQIYDDPLEIQEFLMWRTVCGYGSVFGDGTSIDLALCQHCIKKTIGDILQIQPDIWQEPTTEYIQGDLFDRSE